MIQIIILYLLLAVLIFVRKEKLFYFFAAVSIALSVPLYTFWIFYTAQKLVEFSFLCLLAGFFFSFINSKNNT